jgi:hypothetical protein
VIGGAAAPDDLIFSVKAGFCAGASSFLGLADAPLETRERQCLASTA